MGVIGFLWRGLPAYVWVGLAYAIIIAGAPSPRVMSLEQYLAEPQFVLPLLNNGTFLVSLNTMFVIAAFVAIWIEVMRATSVTTRAGNDGLSIAATFIAILVFVGAESFGTLAFMVVPLAGLGDLLLDRLVGQAVARRDFAIN